MCGLKLGVGDEGAASGYDAGEDTGLMPWSRVDD